MICIPTLSQTVSPIVPSPSARTSDGKTEPIAFETTTPSVASPFLETIEMQWTVISNCRFLTSCNITTTSATSI